LAVTVVNEHLLAVVGQQAVVLAFTLANFNEGEAGTLHSLGYLAHRTGQHEQAMEHYRQALVLLRDRGNAAFEATTLHHLGQALSALGRHDQAREAWRRAVALYREQHRVADGRRVQQQLDALPL